MRAEIRSPCSYRLSDAELNITRNFSVLLAATSRCLHQTRSHKERLQTACLTLFIVNTVKRFHDMIKAGPQCTPDPVTAQHFRTVVVVRNRPTHRLPSGTEPWRPGSFCWTPDMLASFLSTLQVLWSSVYRYEDNEFLLLLLFLTSFDFVTSFDICR